MARRLLLDPAGIPDDRIFMIPTGVGSPSEAASLYEDTIRSFFKIRARNWGGDFPIFDMVLLSMGTDGHIASLFRGTEALEEKEKWVTISKPLKINPPIERITITLPVINRARSVLMLVSGEEKKAIARAIMAEPKETAGVYPAARVKPAGREIWMIADA